MPWPPTFVNIARGEPREEDALVPRKRAAGPQSRSPTNGWVHWKQRQRKALIYMTERGKVDTEKREGGALEDIQITPEMMEAGANFLIESGYLSADHVAITESLKAMMKDLLLAALSGKSLQIKRISHL